MTRRPRTRRIFRRRRMRVPPAVAAALIATALAAALITAVCSRQAEAPAHDPAPAATGDGARALLPSCRPPFDGVRCADPASMQPARALRVVDGDTIDVDLAGTEERVRFYGIDTAERGEPCYAEAADRLRLLLDGEVRLRPDARDRDRFGRLLRYVYLPDGTSLDAQLIAEGLAHAWRDDGALRDPLVALEDRTHAARTGCLWQ
ncbi:MAG: thermonuclease family protein [Dehalococcoidia bacterium]